MTFETVQNGLKYAGYFTPSEVQTYDDGFFPLFQINPDCIGSASIDCVTHFVFTILESCNQKMIVMI